ncbi:MAG: hypothetical protein IAC23_06750 [Bacteroidetes bacterium]|uniref:DUF5050 domain-containing protein n=1 Tax=Candidatus Cryptobacteroides merdavium TaxID=2840769 RepID=A0A9D9EE96_9BACT|nr:hypothetical protein [Candidatus Cryptobacteroides merdavium]
MKGKGFYAVAAVLPAALVMSCGTIEVDAPGDVSGTGQGPGGGQTVPLPEEKELYVTGVEYPEGYDWHADENYGHVACKVFLMKEGERIVELSADERNLVTSDADMHRCVDGHLYTDYSTESETVIKMDGEELFRYQEREMICGFQVVDGDVYTLGMPRDGADGWTWRRNGDVMMSRTSGYIMNGLSLDNGSMWFTYVDPVVSGDKVKERYYLVSDGKTIPVGAAADVEKVDDILLYGGVTYYTARLQGMNGHVVYIGEQAMSVPAGSARETLGCRIHYAGRSIYVSGTKRFAMDGSMDMPSLWKDFKLDFNYQGSSTVMHGYYVDSDDIYCVYTDTQHDELRVYKSGLVDSEHDAFKYSYLSHAGGCAADGHFSLALHPAAPGVLPALLTDGEVKEYDFNGYFTSVSYW